MMREGKKGAAGVPFFFSSKLLLSTPPPQGEKLPKLRAQPAARGCCGVWVVWRRGPTCGWTDLI